MFGKKADTRDKTLKALSEKEIRNQLYGEYIRKGEHRVEVMDSTPILKEKQEPPIEEKIDAKTKKEISSSLNNLKLEFKHLQEEVNKLRKEKETLERSESLIKLPFIKTKHLVAIGSVVVLVLVIVASIVAIRFIVTNVGAKRYTPATVQVPKSSKIYTVQVYSTTQKEDADKMMRMLSSKKFLAFLNESTSSTGRTMYVIFVGEYADKKEAEEAARLLRKEKEFNDAFVVTKAQ